jgi:hypothetical protein
MELFVWRYPASRKQWDFVITDHADLGRLTRSMLLAFESPKPLGVITATEHLATFQKTETSQR